VTYQQSHPEAVSSRSWLTALLLCFFLGVVGAHRFYTGKTGTAILMIVTCGGAGVWTLIDLIMIIVGSFKDSEGLPVKNQG
jgi:TM2 domain-containing membrane protein YozV